MSMSRPGVQSCHQPHEASVMSTLKFPPFGKDWPAGEKVRLNTHENADEDEDDTDQEVEGVTNVDAESAEHVEDADDIEEEVVPATLPTLTWQYLLHLPYQFSLGNTFYIYPYQSFFTLTARGEGNLKVEGKF